MKISALLYAALASILSITADSGTCSGPQARVKPPPGAIVVDAMGDPKRQGSYRTMKEGVAKLDISTVKQQTIFIFPGVYKEQVVVPLLQGALVIQGATCDATSYVKNQVTITHAMAQKHLASGVVRERNALTSTMRFRSNNVKVYNLNIANTAGLVGQAVAASVDGTNCSFYGCNFIGNQDTLLTTTGRQLYAKSRISGTVDFIFGMYAVAWFEDCDIDSIGRGFITANGRPSEDSDSFYVFNHARVYSSDANAFNTTFLGRPWRSFARVVWQNSELGRVVNPAGWSKWRNDDPTKLYFREFNNFGPGAATGHRANFSQQLNKAVDIKELFGNSYKSEWWVDPSYL
ncbi:unnamed protein product [Hyaloperonospora brassicae]|uniref:Pectinesterase n=1 Tax=Hyaloperonospora brassicae TaxID=162125 RepID=A0AAV0TU18_HYABA|nr:unnamed protein product [Hyaloperonospora brassicae]